jgi:CheY-like chemotaxis protein
LLKDFKSHGMSLSMDDFGTGYSALAYLKHYPFDYVKIDQSFVRDIMTNSGDAAISNAVISMAHSMGIRVIAEGVETEAQCDFLSKNMCDLVQGYYLSQPVPPDQAGAFIQTQFCLPEHLLRIEKTARTLLVVDDEQNILASLKRLFRRDAYVILTANSGKEGLEILKEHKVDVIISDQRMPAMTGVDFLRQAKAGYPDTVRIVLSGYTELQSITDAINEGSIYKFLTKPWEDEQLRDQIKEAFQHKEMSDENRKLGLKIQTANHELATANRRLAEMLQQKEHQINRDGNSLEIAREALQAVPIPLIGVDEDGMIAFANAATEILFIEHAPLLGAHIDQLLPDFSDTASRIAEGENFTVATLAHDYQVNWRNMGESSRSRGKLITFFRNG